MSVSKNRHEPPAQSSSQSAKRVSVDNADWVYPPRNPKLPSCPKEYPQDKKLGHTTINPVGLSKNVYDVTAVPSEEIGAFDNPYSGYYSQPAYDNPDSLYNSTGQVISSEEVTTRIGYPSGMTSSPPTPGASQVHPSYNFGGPTPTTTFSSTSGRQLDGSYGGTESGFAQGSTSTVHQGMGNSPRSPSRSSTKPDPPFGERTPQLSGNPGGVVPALVPNIGTPVIRHGNMNSNEVDTALLNPHGDGSGHGVDRSRVGGFTELLGEEEDSNIRYGRIPQRKPRRHRTKKRYELFHGNLVIDNEVPSKLLDMCPLKTQREFKFMRYTAATCDPDNYKSEGYTLRPAMFEPARKTELFIVMTMYNEDEEWFCRSMSGVVKNIQHLITRERSKTWGKEGWKKVVVCIVSDGRQKINSCTLSVIAAMGAYQDGVAKNAVNGKLVTAHIYEYTSQISVAPDVKIGPQKDPAPIQIIFCLKERRQKKINSHRWAFNAFGPVLEPHVCVLLDIGTMPGPTSIYHLWKCFDINSNIGGACGELIALKGKSGVKLWNPLVAAQDFEYKMGHIFDKSFESVFGYITVLPGAFSAYRYIALQNDSMGKGPLRQYFRGETMQKAEAGIFKANMYLAEDRILCWEIVAKRGGQWILHYVKSAYAETDVPENIPELISQRRRWLNGSLFVAVYSIAKFGRLNRSSHTPIRKLFIYIELVYQVYTLFFGWISLANYYISFIIFANALEDPSFNIPWIRVVNICLNYAYLGLLIVCYVLAFGSRPQGSKWGYFFVVLGFTFITLYMTGAAIFLIIKGIQDLIQHAAETRRLTFGELLSALFVKNILGELLVTLSAYILASIAFFEPWHLITSLFQYFLLASSYISVLTVYAFCNIHDVSWGTKGDNKVSTDLGAAIVKGKNKNEVEAVIPTEQMDMNAAYEDALCVLFEKPPRPEQKRDQNMKQDDSHLAFRTTVLLVWTFTNGLLAAVVVSYINAGSQAVSTCYQVFVLGSVAALAFIRLLGAAAYMLTRLFAGE